MKDISVLDVTLRDGGCVNDFNFGQEYMDKILASLEMSDVEFIELGYIDGRDGSEAGRTKFCNEKVIQENFLGQKKQGKTYVAMVDYGKYDFNRLSRCSGEGIDGIRLAFHKKDWRDAIAEGRKILDKGYQLFVQPMLSLRYSDGEMLELIEAVNGGLPDASAFYIVDSFGEMRKDDVTRLMYLVANNLREGMPMGFHSHNNLQLSYSNAMLFLDFPTQRKLIVDSSIMGMGKGAGNLNTEILLEHLNKYYGKQYKVLPLLNCIDKVVNVVYQDKPWGYSAEYYLSAVNQCSPSYAGYFYDRHRLQIGQIAELLGLIRDDKKISFDPQYADQVYLEYNNRNECDDAGTVEELREALGGRRILLIAPGKSILRERGRIRELRDRGGIVSISLNNFEFNTDYVFATRAECFDEAVRRGKPAIVPSDITHNGSGLVKVIDYRKWTVVDGQIYDSSGVMLLNLLQALNVGEILLAGFDGFSKDMNENYFDYTMRSVSKEGQWEISNRFFTGYIGRLSKELKITFVTASRYEEGIAFEPAR